jgi:hypothetical protein
MSVNVGVVEGSRRYGGLAQRLAAALEGDPSRAARARDGLMARAFWTCSEQAAADDGGATVVSLAGRRSPTQPSAHGVQTGR